jgi:photosystem II stability/assembly factor-like uncharacterized protein
VTASFRGVSAVSDAVVWVSGSAGTVVRTVDGGQTWQKVIVPDSAGLDFRDIDAIDANTAYVLSIDKGKSHIFKTVDAGAHWVMQFTPDPGVFLDAMSFRDATHGYAIADSMAGRFVLFATSDGEHWTRVPPDTLPAALPDEGAFSASGSNIAIADADHVWIATGSRVLYSRDGGKTWAIAASPLPPPANTSTGIFSIAFRDATHGIVVGGDYAKPNEKSDNCAITSDGGATWTLVKTLSGFRSAVNYVPHARAPSLIGIGTSGADYSVDDGKTWASIGIPAVGPMAGNFNAFSFSPSGKFGWAVGPRGRFARFEGVR